MSKTYNICEVTVTIPSLGTITTDGAGNQIKRGDKCRVHLYAVKPDWHSRAIFGGFNVGVITFTGYTESPFKRSQKIMMPDGYKLVALRVDDDGMPTSWDSLPVQFVGGLISLNDADGAIRAKIGKIDGAEHAAGMAVGVEGDQSKVVFEADRFKVHDAVQSIIGNAVATNAKTKIRLGDEMKQAVIDAVRESDLFASLEAKIDAQTASVVGLQQAMHDAVNDALRKALKPGGTIWTSLKRGF